MLPTNDHEFLQAIFEILYDNPGIGSFVRRVEIDGMTLEYTFSQSTGLGSDHYRKRYVTHFKSEPPAWVDLVHPYSIFCLCKFALEADKQLPQNLGEFYLAQVNQNSKRANWIRKNW